MKPWIVLAAIASYFILLFLISALASRKGTDNDSFFSGGRRAPWIVVAIAAIGAPITGVTFCSVPGMVITKGYSYLQMAMGFVAGYFVIAFMLVPLFYKMNLKSIYGYLEDRYGTASHRSGAWLFFISKMLGASVRFLVVCIMLQTLVFGPLGLPFELDVMLTIALIFLYTLKGGVNTVVWTDMLKSICMVASVILCIVFTAKGLGMNFGVMASAVSSHDTSRIFFFDNPKEGTYFWKQFLAGIYMVIAMTGLDQDLMQRSLACRDYKASRKSMVMAGITQFFIIGMFLVLGSLLVMYYQANISPALPERSDELFCNVATHPSMPIAVGILFIVGLVAASYSAAGSALTALTTSFTVDILGAHRKQDEKRLGRTRRLVHLLMAICMGAVIIVFYYLSSQDAISAVFTLASYTYGPILGLFAFGMASRMQVKDKYVPVVCIAAPVICFFIQRWLLRSFDYTLGFELLLLNAALTMLGLLLLGDRDPSKKVVGLNGLDTVL